MSRQAYDQWRDRDGVHISDGCRVEQVAVATEHGATPSRLHKRGEVIGRGTNRVNVRFDGEPKVVSVRPHLVRVLLIISTALSEEPAGRTCDTCAAIQAARAVTRAPEQPGGAR